MNKIGVFGGTFNPVHKGHEKIAAEFYEKFNIDKLLIVPTFITPQKIPDAKILPYQRFEMCKLAFYAEEYRKHNIEVSDIEIKKEGKSYSVDTVTALYDIYGREKSVIYFLIGADMFLSIETWRRYEELLNLCVLVVAYRFGDGSEMEDKKEKKEKILAKKDFLTERGYRIETLDNSVFEISSSELRDRLKSGLIRGDELSRYLNGDVIEYIKRKNLYM
jgi:nicotinate-nucleotide adenylyltransferase